jgi:hypothetical protein
VDTQGLLYFVPRSSYLEATEFISKHDLFWKTLPMPSDDEASTDLSSKLEAIVYSSLAATCQSITLIGSDCPHLHPGTHLFSYCSSCNSQSKYFIELIVCLCRGGQDVRS